MPGLVIGTLGNPISVHASHLVLSHGLQFQGHAAVPLSVGISTVRPAASQQPHLPPLLAV